VLAALPSGLFVMVAGGLALVLGLLTLTVLLIRFLAGERRSKQVIWGGVALCVSAVVITYSLFSFQTASAQFKATALRFQAICSESLKCPIAPPGWANRPDRDSMSTAGVYAKFPMFYATDGKMFTLRMSMGPDLSRNVVGGVGHVLQGDF